MNLGAEIPHQYTSSQSSFLTGQQARGMSCAKVSRDSEEPRSLHLATDPSPQNTGQDTCVRLTGVSGAELESRLQS